MPSPFDFSELAEEYYPGSRERRHTVSALTAPAVDDDLLGEGTVMVLRGQQVEFFGIGQVARAINRKAGTLRKWETDGVLPQSGFVKPSDDPRGVRRLYSRPQAEAILRAAKDSGIMESGAKHPLGKFRDMVHTAFREIKEGK